MLLNNFLKESNSLDFTRTSKCSNNHIRHVLEQINYSIPMTNIRIYSPYLLSYIFYWRLYITWYEQLKNKSILCKIHYAHELLVFVLFSSNICRRMHQMIWERYHFTFSDSIHNLAANGLYLPSPYDKKHIASTKELDETNNFIVLSNKF